jgi:hypothetical protein
MYLLRTISNSFITVPAGAEIEIIGDHVEVVTARVKATGEGFTVKKSDIGTEVLTDQHESFIDVQNKPAVTAQKKVLVADAQPSLF